MKAGDALDAVANETQDWTLTNESLAILAAAKSAGQIQFAPFTLMFLAAAHIMATQDSTPEHAAKMGRQLYDALMKEKER